MTLYQRGADGNCMPGDSFTHANYGKIPDSEFFQNKKGGKEKPVTVHGWQYSQTFKQWQALVTFASGWHGFTWVIK